MNTESETVPFDPARHLVKDGKPVLHPRTGKPMPRGGRKPKNASASSGSTSSPPSAADVSPSSTSAPSPADSPAAPADAAETFKAIDEAFASIPPPPVADEAANGDPAPAANVELVEMSDDVAEIIATAFYNLAGFVFDAPEEWALAGNEHNRTRRAIAAYVRTRGGSIGPGKAVLILGAAYVLRGLAKPKSRVKARAAFATLRGHLFPKKAVRAAPEKTESAPPSPTPAAPRIVSLSELHNSE